MNVIVALNGEIRDYRHIKNMLKRYRADFVICADGGINHVHEIGLIPNMLIGDMDSAKPEIIAKYRALGTELSIYPSAKDEIDGQLAVDEAIKLKPESIVVIGALGKRIDQTVASFHLLHRIDKKGIDALILDDDSIIRVISKKTYICGDIGDTLSIIPFGGEVKGIVLSGFEYPLNGAVMGYGYPYGISNVINTKDAFVDLSDGSLLVIHYYTV